MRGSDLDIMFVDKRIEVYEDVKPRLYPNVPFITMKTDDVKPGFTHLELEHNRDHSLSADWNRNITNRCIQNTVSCDDSLTKCMYAYYMSRLCSLHVQTYPLMNIYSNNKYQYKQYKVGLCSLLQNINHDAVSGWLMVASFFYKTKQYTKALPIIKYSISKCTFEKLYPFMVMSDTHQQLFNYESLKQKSIVHLWKLLFVDFITFKQNSVLIPDELQVEVDGTLFFSSSSSYVYFLSFLCHYHLKNIRQCYDSLLNLRTVISESYLIADEEFKASACDLLGVALQVLGDSESARQAFVQSVELCHDLSDNPAVKRLLLMR
ncbi:unnamed protein product [Mytilus coruscus]|uniref:Uncharacterized protein n=1 Tax=Mytilus coruscus TaxID=42192 RepID=A0A6J8CRE1_MYTCO|nr:unnamed protein product [Mytilus coruscus]